jgi:cell division protein ZapE
MHQVHGSLTALAGQKDPLPALAKAWAQRIQVLYLDELVVADIADAMMIENLFRALVACGIFLIISANRRPDQLYLGGVNHAAFLPAIAWMEAHLTIYHLASKYDYRSGMTLGAGAFLTPISAESEQRMQKMFSGWAKGAGMTHEIMVCDRTFPVKLRSDTVLWVDFDVICSPPRSQDDYLELVKTYRYWLVSSVPKLEQNDQITLLIKLIDLLYEAHVPLVMEAVGPLEAIAPEGALAFRFQRTRSRIQYLTS